MKKFTKAFAFSLLIGFAGLSTQAQAWWGPWSPWGGWGPWDGWGFGDFGFSFGMGGSLAGRGWGYAPYYGYPFYGLPYYGSYYSYAYPAVPYYPPAVSAPSTEKAK